MKNIDKLFENEIKKNSLPYKEMYWQDMEVLLDKDKKRKKIIYFRLTALALAISSITLSVLYYSTNGHTQPNKSTAQLLESSITKTTKSTPNNNTDNLLSNSIEAIKKPIENVESGQKSKVSYSKTFETENKINHPSLKTKLNASTNEASTHSTLNKSEPNSIDQSTLMLISNDESEMGYTGVLHMNGISRFASMLNAQEFEKIDFTQIPFDRLRKVSKKNPFTSTPEHFLAAYINYNPVIHTHLSQEAAAKSGEEQYRSTIGYGLQYRLKKNRFIFSTGIGFNNTVIISNYTSENRTASYDTTYKIINPNYDQTYNGTRIALIKSFIDTNISSYLSNPYPNQKTVFSYLTLPFSMQYCMQYKRLSWYVEAGIEAKFLVASSGQFWFLENGKQKIESAQNSAMRSTILNAGLGIGIRLPVVKDIQLFSGIHYYSPLNSMVSGYTQKLGTARINLGFEFRLK